MYRQKGLKSTEYRFLDYLLTEDNQLIRNNIFIRTGSKELAVLRALIESAGKLMTKDELLDQVWGTTFVSEESLARCIYVLRKIFKKHKSNAVIQTVYSKGYIFVAEVIRHLPPEKEVEKINEIPTFEGFLETLFGNRISYLDVSGQKHIAIEIKILLPAPDILSKNN